MFTVKIENLKVTKKGMNAVEFCERRGIEKVDEIFFNKEIRIEFSTSEVESNPFLKELFKVNNFQVMENKTKDFGYSSGFDDIESLLFLDMYDWKEDEFKSNDELKRIFLETISRAEIDIKEEDSYYLEINTEAMFMIQKLLKINGYNYYFKRHEEFKDISKDKLDINFPKNIIHGGKAHLNMDIKVFKNLAEVIKLQTSYKYFIDTETEKNKGKPMHESVLKDFNGHEWVKFYVDESDKPHVEFAEGCHYTSMESFEMAVEEDYGEDMNGAIYRTYMMEAEKLRLALEMPPRVRKENVVVIRDFISLLQFRIEEFKNFIANVEGYYAMKNHLWSHLAWIEVEKENIESFQYLNGDDDDYYYDLVTVKQVIDENCYRYAIPVPILAEALKVTEKSIFECFVEHSHRDNVDWI